MGTCAVCVRPVPLPITSFWFHLLFSANRNDHTARVYQYNTCAKCTTQHDKLMKTSSSFYIHITHIHLHAFAYGEIYLLANIVHARTGDYIPNINRCAPAIILLQGVTFFILLYGSGKALELELKPQSGYSSGTLQNVRNIGRHWSIDYSLLYLINIVENIAL